MASGRTVRIRVNGTGNYSTTTDNSGYYWIENITISVVNDVLTVYLDGASEKAVTVTKASSTDGNISGLDLYENRVIVRHEADQGQASTTIADLAQYDGSDSADIRFTATTTNGTATTTTIFNGNKLYVWPSNTFDSGGEVTVSGNAVSSPDGDLHIATGATYVAGATTTVGGNWIASTSATFTHNSFSTIFSASTTGKEITTQGTGNPFYNLKFDGVGGGWTFTSGDHDIDNDFTITNGSVTSTNGTLYVGGNWANDDIFNATTGTVTFNDTAGGKTIVASTSPFYILTFDGASGGWTITTDDLDVDNNLNITNGTLTAGSQSITLAGNLDLASGGLFSSGSGTTTFDGTGTKTWADANASAQDMGDVVINGSTETVNLGSDVKATKLIVEAGNTLGAGSYTLTISGSGTGALRPFIINGTFDEGNSIVNYEGSATTDIEAEIYYTLRTNQAANTFQLYGHTTTTNDLNIAAGILDVTTNNYELVVGNNWTNAETFTARQGKVRFTATDSGNQIITNNSAFYLLEFNGASGEWTTQDAATSTATTTLIQGTLIQAADYNLDLASFTIQSNASFTAAVGTGRLYFEGADPIFVNDVDEENNLGDVYVGYSPADTYQDSDWIVDSMTVNSGDAHYTQGYEIDCANSVTVYGTLDATDTGETDVTNITVGGDWTIEAGGSFVHGNSTTTFSTTTAGQTITTQGTGNPFYDVVFNGSGGTWSFVTGDHDIDRDFILTAGGVTSTDGTLQVGGSWTNSDTFTHNSGTVLFDSADTGEEIDTGQYPFNIVTFNNSGGGWTVTADASSTNNWNLTTSSDFTVDTNISIEVQGNYIISDTMPEATTWNTGSTLYLNSGSTYIVGSKTQSAEDYYTLQLGVDTEIRAWNSSSTLYTVDSTGSLYSQDHDNSDCYLYIFGDYHSSTTDWWSYEYDFDGVVGADRQVFVYLAANATTTLDSGDTLNATGTDTATTTIDRQGTTGNYAIKVEGGTLDMSYYSIRNIDSYGLNLTGTPTITSLDYGDYELNLEGGTLMTVASTTINNNIELTITGCRFATTSDLTVAYNVTATGTATSFWTFASHYGNLDGESYDSDPGGDPGYIQWDDSSVPYIRQYHFRWRADDGGE